MLKLRVGPKIHPCNVRLTRFNYMYGSGGGGSIEVRFMNTPSNQHIIPDNWRTL
jgi:hypothetical protein